MRDSLLNRLARHKKVLTYLDTPTNLPHWQNVPPLKFTGYVTDLRAGVTDYEAKAGQQDAPISPEEQNREEQELEDRAYPLSNALFEYYTDEGREADAAEWELSLSEWRRCREQTLLQKAQRLLEQLGNLPLGSGSTLADDYGISAAAIAALQAEYDDYAAVIGEPGARRATRVALTGSGRARMRVLDGFARSMDKLVTSFNGTAEGKLFVDGYFAARRVDDLGHGPSEPTEPPTEPEP